MKGEEGEGLREGREAREGGEDCQRKKWMETVRETERERTWKEEDR